MNGADPAPAAAGHRRWLFGAVVLDERSMTLAVDGQPVAIERKPMEILLHLLRHAGEVVTKEELLAAVWPGRAPSDTALTSCVYRLRDVLNDADQQIIRTQHGYGYRLVAPVRVESSAAAATPGLQLKAGDHPPQRPLWSLVQQLGTGGHGEVWLAQHETRERRVFKFATDVRHLASLKREITLSRLLRDSLGERAAIAPILDWNLEEPPYFIEIEHVAGGSLTQWADSQGGLGKVPPAARLDIAAQVAEALAAAHSVGVLHKDLKPGNVLVQPASGKILLCDFGSGGVLDAARLEALGITRMGFTKTVARLETTSGTPVYLAPEVLAGQPFTVQADIFALGVLLYQLAVGDLKRPLAHGWEQDVTDDLLRDDIAGAVQGRADQRIGDAHLLATRLRTLEQRRAERRAQQEEQQAARQARQLAEERAREAQLALERVRARRGWVRATVAALSAGVVSAGVLYWQARQSQRQAEESAVIAQGINRFLTDKVLGGADPRRGPVRDLTVRKLFDSAAASIPEDVEANPEVAARIHDAFGTAYAQMGLYKSAVAHLERAVHLYRELHGGASPEVAAASASLVTATLYSGDHDRLCEVADWLVQFHQSRPGSDAALLNARFSRAMCLRFQNKTPEAVAEFEAILPEVDQLQPDDPELKLRTLQNLGVTQYEGGEPGQAEQTLARALAHAEQAYGARHVLTAKVRWRRGRALHNAGRLKDAEQDYLAGHRDLDAWLGPDSADAVTIESFLAQLYYQLGRFREAEAMIVELLPRIPADFTASGRLALLNLLALLREREGRCSDVLALAEESLALQKAANYPPSWFGVGARVPRIACLRRQHRLPEARAELDEISRTVAAGSNDVLPAESSAVEATLGEANGLLLLEEGKAAEAVDTLSRALAALRSRPDAQEWQLRELAVQVETARRRAADR